MAVDDFDEERMETLVGPAFNIASEEVSFQIQQVFCVSNLGNFRRPHAPKTSKNVSLKEPFEM